MSGCADYWGRDLPVNRGLYHFDRIRIEFYRDRQAAFEAFKKGDILYRQEFTSRVWATGYDFPAINDGKVVKREFPGEKRPSMQAMALNQRRERFRDARVRQAIGALLRLRMDEPQPVLRRLRALALHLRALATTVPRGCPRPPNWRCSSRCAARSPKRRSAKRCCSQPPTAPAATASCSARASKLLAEAGWKRKGTSVENDKGERLTLEFLVEDDTFTRVFTPFVENMRAIGIDASIRMVDSAQYTLRQTDFDFDMISVAFSFSATPTRDDVELFFHSRWRRQPELAQPAGHQGPGGRRTGCDRRRGARTGKA